jgi:hypothetical protein
MSLVAEEPQSTLFDINTRKINPYWIDPAAPLLVPQNPLHFHAHKLQLLLARMEVQAEKNGAQFNSANYFNALEKFTSLCEAINKGAKSIDEVPNARSVANTGDAGAAPGMGETTPPSLDTGISPDNPAAG